jgi:hypothetical protein
VDILLTSLVLDIVKIVLLATTNRIINGRRVLHVQVASITIKMRNLLRLRARIVLMDIIKTKMEKMVVKFARVDETQFILLGQDVQRAPKEKHQPLEQQHVLRVRQDAIKSRMLPPTTIVDTARLVHPRILRAKALATIASPVNIQIKMDELHV